MADHDDWTADDDARLRAALGSLRADVEGAPLPDVRFVKARGMARRRQRLFSWTAAAAAAAVVVGTVGYSQFGRNASLETPPATQSSTTSAAPSPTTTDSIDQPGALPLLQEWTRALGLEGTARMTTQEPKSADYRSFECLTSIPQGQKLRQQVTLDAGGFEGGQTQFAVSAKLDPQTVAEGIASDIAECQQGPDFKVTPQGTSGWPQLLSYTAGDAGSGWFAVVPGAADVTLIQIADAAHPTSIFTQAQVADLARIAADRLARYGSGTTSSTATSTPTATGSSGPKAVNEKMQVSGPDPVPSWNLFVAASQWTDPLFAKGQKATPAAAGNTADLGYVDIPCETDSFLSGEGGRVGVVEVRAGGHIIGRQRVRLFEDTQASELASADLARLDALLRNGCTAPAGDITTTKAGPSKGTYLLTTKSSVPGAGSSYTWVGVSLGRTEGAITTITFMGLSDGALFQGTPAQGFAELDRLLALARQK